MKLITTVKYIIEKEILDEEVQYQLSQGKTLDEVQEDEENLMFDEVLDKLSNKLDNNGYITNWSEDTINMNWEE